MAVATPITVGQRVMWRDRPAVVLEVSRLQARIEYHDPRGRLDTRREAWVAISDLKGESEWIS